MTAAWLLVVLAQTPPVVPEGTDPRGVAVIEKFAAAWKNVRTITYVLTKTERMRNGEMREEEVLTKVRKPSSVYLAARKPAVGQEVIYVGTRDVANVVVHPGKFPDVTLTLDVQGALVTQNQHHLVHHTGFTYALGILKASIERSLKDPNGERLEYGGEVQVNGRKAEVAILYSGTKAPRWVKAKEGETLFDLAKRTGQDAYAIFYVNPKIDEGDFADTLEEGQSYQIPAYYCAKSELVLDVELQLPLRQSCWDTAGRLYEKFEYRDMVVNPALSDKDFDPENPAYNF